MAGAGYKLFQTGDVLTAAQVNTYLNEQTVMVFADSAARTTALSGVLAEGMMSYLQDTNAVEVYNGSAWVAVGGGGLTSPLTTKGDIWVYGTGDTRLPVGTNGHTLVADSVETTGLKWVAPASGSTFVGAYAYSTTAQSIGNAYTAIDLVGEAWDTDGFHSTSTNTPRMTIPAGKGGYYLAMFTCNWATGGTATKIIGIAVNGTGGDLLTSFDNQANGLRHNCFRVIDVDAGDYIQAVAYSGDTKNMNNAYLQIIYLGA
jgi:hypothetical protein